MTSTGESTATETLRCTIDLDAIQAEFSVEPDGYGEWHTGNIDLESLSICGVDIGLWDVSPAILSALREWAAENGDWR